MATVAAPTPDMLDQARTLAAKLGCPDATVSPGGGASNGAAEATCDVPAPASSFTSTWHYDISVWPDSTALAGYLGQVRAAYNPARGAG